MVDRKSEQAADETHAVAEDVETKEHSIRPVADAERVERILQTRVGRCEVFILETLQKVEQSAGEPWDEGEEKSERRLPEAVVLAWRRVVAPEEHEVDRRTETHYHRPADGRRPKDRVRRREIDAPSDCQDDDRDAPDEYVVGGHRVARGGQCAAPLARVTLQTEPSAQLESDQLGAGSVR